MRLSRIPDSVICCQPGELAREAPYPYPVAKTDDKLRCSFCNRSEDEVNDLMGNPKKFSPRAYICNDCVSICHSLMLGEEPPDLGEWIN
jgi:ClpX C4-type zinc finger